MGFAEGEADAACVNYLFEQSQPVGFVAVKDCVGNAGEFVRFEVLQHVDQREGELPFLQIGPECFSRIFFSSKEVETIIIDLVGHSQMIAIGAEGLCPMSRAFVESRRGFAGDAEQGTGFHSDDAEVFGQGEFEIEPALHLQNLARTDFIGGVSDELIDFAHREGSAKAEGMCEKAITEQHGEIGTPFAKEGGFGTTDFCVVEDVIVNERGQMDELDNHR